MAKKLQPDTRPRSEDPTQPVSKKKEKKTKTTTIDHTSTDSPTIIINNKKKLKRTADSSIDQQSSSSTDPVEHPKIPTTKATIETHGRNPEEAKKKKKKEKDEKISRKDREGPQEPKKKKLKSNEQTELVEPTHPDPIRPQIDPSQLVRAIESLIDHSNRSIKKDPPKPTSQEDGILEDLFDRQIGSNECFLNLIVGLKRILSKPKHKPVKLSLSHPLFDPRISPVCLIVKDPQREYKDLLEELNITFISKVVGIEKLKGKHSSYEARRLLLSSHALFLVDERVMPMLPRILGVKFFKSNKLPIPVKLSEKMRIKVELERAISNTSLRIGAGSCLSIKLADLSLLDSRQIQENLRSVIDQLGRRIPLGGWRNVQSLHLKTGTSISLPIWLAPLDPTSELSRFDLTPTEEEANKIQAFKDRLIERKNRKRIKISSKLKNLV